MHVLCRAARAAPVCLSGVFGDRKPDHRSGFLAGLFPEVRFIEKHTTCNDLTLLHGPHLAVQKGGPGQGRPRVILQACSPIFKGDL